MAYTDHATWQLYETYHTPVNVRRDLRTYDHFSSLTARQMRQENLLTTYLTQMIAAIREDIDTRGDCWLLQDILTREVPAIHLLDHSAIAYVYATVFTPEEAPQPDQRTIPYSAAYSTSVGGMRYADRRARTCVIDLRCDDTLHPLCHALRMCAERQREHNQVLALTQERTALLSRITQLQDRILGLEHDLARFAPAEPTAE